MTNNQLTDAIVEPGNIIHLIVEDSPVAYHSV